MKRRSTFTTKLHGGACPRWLFNHMKKLAKPLTRIVIDEYGTTEFLRRISDPLYFQAFSNVLGYDWNSSGVTTVLCGVLKEVLTLKLGIQVAGGKGGASLRTPHEIRKIGTEFNFSNKKQLKIVEASKKAAKVDNAVLQDGHSLYHHSVFIDRHGAWSVVQQGMNPKVNSARRYHWTSESLSSFVIDPHKAISGEAEAEQVLNLPTKQSLEAQKTSVDLVRDGVKRVKSDIGKLRRKMRGTPPLSTFFSEKETIAPRSPQNVDFKVNWEHLPWKRLEKAYELQPQDFEALIQVPGIGPKTIRALSLVSELIYEADLSWEDPIRYTYAHGGKDGVPYPVQTDRMEKVSNFLQEVVKQSKLGKKEKKQILEKLASFSKKKEITRSA